ncbi:unnamed protein product [Danaus chrysippus]|uniref:(African queen) hypothetical protein n=1 Tax=Danaus chrysippus TaxID=151541 RepID=A0A8J2QQI2_9NEOP|nr:unnamed protein product [Danaus chrysippus]
MMINSAKPNIKLDKALQDIVYKLVPGLSFKKRWSVDNNFYASRPGPAASATPEQRGEDTERIIFSPEDVISFSLEYSDATDTDSISSKSSDSNEPQPATASTRRKGTQFPDRKPSPTCTEDTNVSSPIPHINDNGSEASSGTDSPMPDDNLKKLSDTIKKEAQKTPKTSSPKSTNDNATLPKETPKNVSTPVSKTEETLKRKIEPSKAIPEMKKIKIEVDKTKSPTTEIIVFIQTTNGGSCTEKRNVSAAQTLTSPKRKTSEPTTAAQPSPLVQKTVSPLKLQIPKPEAVSTLPKHVDTPKTVSKKMPDLKPSIPSNASSQK